MSRPRTAPGAGAPAAITLIGAPKAPAIGVSPTSAAGRWHRRAVPRRHTAWLCPSHQSCGGVTISQARLHAIKPACRRPFRRLVGHNVVIGCTWVFLDRYSKTPAPVRPCRDRWLGDRKISGFNLDDWQDLAAAHGRTRRSAVRRVALSAESFGSSRTPPAHSAAPSPPLLSNWLPQRQAGPLPPPDPTCLAVREAMRTTLGNRPRQIALAWRNSVLEAASRARNATSSWLRERR